MLDTNRRLQKRGNEGVIRPLQTARSVRASRSSAVLSGSFEQGGISISSNMQSVIEITCGDGKSLHCRRHWKIFYFYGLITVFYVKKQRDTYSSKMLENT